MTHRTKILIISAGIMFCITTLIITLSGVLSYRSRIESIGLYLEQIASLQASSWEALALRETKHPKTSLLEEMANLQKTRYFGETGELTIGYRDGDQIRFLFPLRFSDKNVPVIPWNSALAEPTRMGISGKAGIIRGLDYRGKEVLAASAAIPSLNMGLSAKIDISEIQRLFMGDRYIISGVSLVLTVIGTLIILIVLNPIIKRIEESELEQKRMNNALIESNKDLEYFAYVASHDLQEPLRMVSSYCELLKRRYSGKLDAKADEFIEYAISGANRMRNLIEALLLFSRVKTTARELAPVDTNECVSEAIQNLKIKISETGAVIKYGRLPIVIADKFQLIAVFQNLIDNGIKFANKIPKISIFCQEKNDMYQFCVKDNGIGIEPEYKQKIFDVFQRLHGHKYPGTGIGLAVCQRTIERHGGEIWVDSKPGFGSKFYFTLRKA